MFTSSRTQQASTRRVTRASVAVAVALALAFPAWTAGTYRLPPTSAPARPPSTPAVVGLVIHDLATGGETAASLVQELVGPGVTVSNVVYSGPSVAAGTFTGGTGIIGFERGILLCTGDVVDVVGPNNDDAGVSVFHGSPGDPDLSALIGNAPTRDAAVLEFDIDCPAGSVMSFEYVYGSEEYDESVGHFYNYNDVFGCFLNGQNIAWVPGTNDPMALQFVNCGHPYDPPVGPGCAYYVTNDCETLGFNYPCTTTLATEIDGLTGVFRATGTLVPGLNHVKLAIADHLDGNLDSYVFLRGQTFHCASASPAFGSVTPTSQVLKAVPGVPIIFDVSASATNGLSGESVTLDVAGDAVLLAGGTFTPAMPTGPAQPASTQFVWTPTAADLGIHHLEFTATDQILESASCHVAIFVSLPDAPEFLAPSPCGQILDAWTGISISFTVSTAARNGLSSEAMILDVTGAPSGGTFLPPLPAGPAPAVTTQFSWIPTLGDLGDYPLVFTATDQLQSTTSCSVGIRVRRAPGVDLCQPGVGGVMDCPCSNPPANAPRGCDNSSATGGARLTSTGDASVLHDTTVFHTDGQIPATLSIFVQGTTILPAGVVYGQGVRCFGGLLKRLFNKLAVGGSITVPQAGDPSVVVRSGQRGDPIQAGQTRVYAVYYRDGEILGACLDAANFNVTQTQEVLWGP